MIEYLNHTNCRKIDGVFHFDFRTQQAADLVAEMAKAKGMKVVVNVIGVPRYFKTKEEHLKHLLTIPDFKEFYTELGLKLN